jgi:hypothetical protein
MSLKQFSIRLEISFWQIVIQLLSESHTVQRVIAWVCNLGIPGTTRFFHCLDSERMLRWAAVGLLIGFLAGLLSTLIKI